MVIVRSHPGQCPEEHMGTADPVNVSVTLKVQVNLDVVWMCSTSGCWQIIHAVLWEEVLRTVAFILDKKSYNDDQFLCKKMMIEVYVHLLTKHQFVPTWCLSFLLAFYVWMTMVKSKLSCKVTARIILHVYMPFGSLWKNYKSWTLSSPSLHSIHSTPVQNFPLVQGAWQFPSTQCMKGGIGLGYRMIELFPLICRFTAISFNIDWVNKGQGFRWARWSYKTHLYEFELESNIKLSLELLYLCRCIYLKSFKFATFSRGLEPH